jgi:DNA-binding NtrC family response regulator
MRRVAPEIAVIDDDASLCRSLSRLLRLAGYEPCAFTSAEQFMADPRRERFGCLLVDIQLGGISGLEMPRLLGIDEQAAEALAPGSSARPTTARSSWMPSATRCGHDIVIFVQLSCGGFWRLCGNPLACG